MAVVDRILPFYVRRREPGLLARGLLLTGLVAVGVLYGLMAAILPASMLIVPMTPILILSGLCLWMLPDIGPIPVARMQLMLIWYCGLFAAWPGYVALDLPGLPWITPQRIASGLLVLLVLVGVAMSEDFRKRLTTTMNEVPAISRLFWGFWAITTVSLLMTRNPSLSINKYMNNQIFWTMMFVVSAYCFSFKGVALKTSRWMLIGMLVTVMAGLYEARIERVYWIDHLPGFLKVDPDLLEKVMKAQNRAGTDIYRVRGTMAASLYYAEYLAMMFPLMLHFVLKTRVFGYRMLLILGMMAMVVVMYLTNARSAMVGLLLTVVIYPFFWVWRGRRRNPGSITSMSILMMYPAGLVAVAMLVLFWPRAHVAVLGGGQHQASSEAREVQWVMGMPKVLKAPLGHGTGTAAEVLGFSNGAGEITIDTYYLSILLEYGLLGLPVFIALFGVPMWYGLKGFLKSNDEETDLIAPFAIGLFNFLIIKGVLSSEGDLPLAFIFLGIVVGLTWQLNRAGTAES
ncbi:MAG: O-antigen ligase family protein, partial [Sphingomonadales bacterium]